MKKYLLLASFALSLSTLTAQTPQYFFQKLNCEFGNTMCFDADSNLWLGCARGGQPLLLKVSRAGILLEQVPVSTGAGNANYLTELIADSDGMLVGVGTSAPINPNDPESSFAFRYDPAARQLLWSRKVTSGYLFLAGIVEQGPGGDFWAYGFNYGFASLGEMFRIDRNTGNVVAGSANDYQLGNSEDIRAALYHKGNFYLTGQNDLSYLYGITVNRYLRQNIARLDSAGSPVWNLLGNVPVTTRSSLVGQDILIEQDTIVSLSSGNDQSELSSSSNLFLQKTTLGGQLVWMKKYNVPSMTSETGKEMVAVSDGYVILGRNASGTDSDFILKTDKNGNVLWAQRLQFSSNYTLAYSSTQNQLLTDGDALYFIGSAYESQKNAAIFAKIDRNGNIAGCNRLAPLTVLQVPLATPFMEKRALKTKPASTASVDVPTELPSPAQLDIQVVCQNEGPAPQNPCEPRTFLKMLGQPGQRQWVTSLRDAPDGNLYLAGRKGSAATLAKAEPDGSMLWVRTLFANSSIEAFTITDLLVDHSGMVTGCGHQGDSLNIRRGFAFRYDPVADTLLWLQHLESERPHGGGIVELSGTSQPFLVYQNLLLPDGRRIPETVQLNRSTGSMVPLSGRRYDFEQGNETFAAAVLSSDDLYTVGQRTLGSGQQRALLANLTPSFGGLKWLQLGHLDTSATASVGSGASVVFDQQSVIMAYTGNPASTTATPTTLFLQKTTAFGVPVWLRRFDIAMQGDVEVLTIPSGYVVFGKTTAAQYFFLKTDLNGNLLVSKKLTLSASASGGIFLEKTQHRAVLLGDYLFFSLHDGGPERDIAFLLKTDLNLDVQEPCNALSALTITTGSVFGPIAVKIPQGLYVSPLNTAKADGAWQASDFELTQICPPVITTPRLTLGPDLTICANKTAVLKATAGFKSYLWQNGSSGSSLTVNAAGLYSVEVKDICGRIQIDTISVSVAPNPAKTVSLLLSSGSTVLLGNTTYFAPDTVTILEPSQSGGCDTLTTYFLLLCTTKTAVDTIGFYPGQKVKLGGNVYSQPSTVVLRLATTEGCDSVVTYTLQWIITSVQAHCPSDLIVNVPPGQDQVAVDYTLPGFNTDCPDQDVALLLLEGGYTGDTFPLGGTKVCYLAFSNCGIRDTCCFTVNVLPAATQLNLQCPADVTVTAPTGSNGATVQYDLPTATTDCANPNIGLTLLEGLPSGDFFQVGDARVCYEATNLCDLRDTCCFWVNVLQPPVPSDPPCDIKSTGSCIRYELLNIRLDSVGQRRYRVRVVNDCASEVVYAVFQLPNGVVAASPQQNATYAAPLTSRLYTVRNPNASPFYSIRYKAVTSDLKNGASDVFEYTLPQQSAPTYIRAGVRLADGLYAQALLSTFDCPEQAAVEVQNQPRAAIATPDSSIQSLHSALFWPNPTRGVLFADLSDWRGQQAQIRVLNAQGQVMLLESLFVGDEAIRLNSAERLPEGLYILHAKFAGGTIAVARFVVSQGDF